MRELHSLDIIRNRPGLHRHLFHLGRRHEEKLRLPVDEPSDQPGTGHPVDLGMFPRHPFHRSPRSKSMITPRPSAEARSYQSEAAATSSTAVPVLSNTVISSRFLLPGFVPDTTCASSACTWFRVMRPAEWA